MIEKSLVYELENLLRLDLDTTMFPYQKGNSIRIGHIVIRYSRAEYKIFDCTNNELIAKTFSKTSAVALARSLAKGKNHVNDILKLDRQIQKHYNDCIFYRNTIRITKDKNKRLATKIRYDDSKAKTENARNCLDKYIFE